jgi:hypothetical protein
VTFPDLGVTVNLSGASPVTGTCGTQAAGSRGLIRGDPDVVEDETPVRRSAGRSRRLPLPDAGGTRALPLIALTITSLAISDT